MEIEVIHPEIDEDILQASEGMRATDIWSSEPLEESEEEVVEEETPKKEESKKDDSKIMGIPKNYFWIGVVAVVVIGGITSGYFALKAKKSS